MTTEEWVNDNIQLLAWLTSVNSTVQEQTGGTWNLWNDDPRYLRALAMEQSLFGSLRRSVDPILGHTVRTGSRLQQLTAPRTSLREPPQQQSTVSEIPEASRAAQNPAFRSRVPRSSRSKKSQVDVGSAPALRLSTTTAPGPDDVIFGRGVTTNRHGGNKRFRSVIAEHRFEYQGAEKYQKTIISQEVVRIIQQRGGRFLQKNKAGDWEQVKDITAREKASQALRDRCRYNGNINYPESGQEQEVTTHARVASANRSVPLEEATSPDSKG
jgi:hypothetical protein